jgi:hypothetical protein
MTWGMWMAAWVPIVVGHFSAKHLSKVSGVDSQQFYGEAMALIVIIQYAYFFIGSAQPFK